jgi:hypothetical protein
VSQPLPFSRGQTTVVPRTQLNVTEQGGGLAVVEQSVTVAELARALNALGVTPRDLIAIFQALKDAGRCMRNSLLNEVQPKSRRSRMELQATPRIPVDLLATQADRLAGLVRSGRTSLAEHAAKSKEALRQAALSFEALFYSTLIKQLRQTTQELGEGLFAGDEADIFGGLFDYYLGSFWHSGSSSASAD